MDIATPYNNKGAHSVDLKWWMLIGKFCTDMTSWLVNIHGRSCLISASIEILRRLKRKSRPLLKRLGLRRISGKWIVPDPKITVIQPKDIGQSEGTGALSA